MSAVTRVDSQTEQKRHWLCMNCGSSVQKTIRYSNGWTKTECGSCGAAIQ